MANEVTTLWERVYPAIVLNDARLAVILSVCENTLNNWRSDIGKAGHRAVVELWYLDFLRFDTAEARADYVAEQLDGLCFVYRYPDAAIGREAFCSPLISVVYSTHLRKISSATQRYGPQIGAIALATIAVERGLTLFKSGEDALKVDKEAKARQLVKTTCRLDDTHWGMIKEHAFAHIGTGGEESDEGIAGFDDDTSGANLHAIIDLDW
ncbi:hypothetical protein V8E52_007960 [Russula decolorans]